MPYDPDAPTTAQEEILDLVFTRMDLVRVDGQTEAVEPAMVWRELTFAVDQMLMVAPGARIYFMGENAQLSASRFGMGLRFDLPSGSLRPLRLTCDEWAHPIHQFDDPSHNLAYQLQSKRSTVARPTEPLAFLVPSSSGGLAVEAYPVGTGAGSQVDVELVHLPRKEPDEVTGELRDALVWEAAARALTHTRDYQAAEAARQYVPQTLLHTTMDQ